MDRLSTVIVGCGNIAGTYADQLRSYPQIDLAGFFDLVPERARQFAKTHGGRAFGSLEEALSDTSVDLVINLTIHHAHAEVITRCLEAGKHVHTEKPLATSSAEARRLVALAEEKGLRLSSAPATFLGEAAQTLGRELRAGKVGTLRLMYAEMNHGRIESWHPNPEPFYEVGPVWDVGVYPLGIWAAFCGPMTRVTAAGRTLLADRKTKEGRAFSLKKPDFFTALVDFQSGATGRLTVNFYVSPSRQGGSMEFHGDDGSLAMGSSYMFNAPFEAAPFGGTFTPIPLAREGFAGVEYARGVQDLADAILDNRPHRCDARVALHVVEVIEAIHASAQSGKPVEVKSRFTKPEPMPWSL